MSSELLHFIQENLVHISDLHLSRKSRTTLALLRNLQFYEVDNKRIINFLDLQESVLNKVQNKLVTTVPVLNGSETQTGSDVFGSPFVWPGIEATGVIIGKYIYQTRQEKKVYILIKCWDVMVVLRRDCSGFTLQAEYEEVQSFRVSKGKDYHVQLEVAYNSSDQDTITNFQTNEKTCKPILNVDAYKKIQKTIKMKKSELLVHKKLTKKQFVKLKGLDTFGSNLLRTPRLDEMQILSKCGNAWVKLTANDDIVIGVPLVNCSTQPTVLRNFRALLHSSQDVDYIFSLYQLSKKVDENDSVQSFFESQNKGDHNWSSWTQCATYSLRPSTVCVLVLSLKIGDIFRISDRRIPLFGFFDIFTLGKIFHLKSFLLNLSLEGIFTNELCRINFNEKHLHRDLLTVIATSYKTEAQLEFYSSTSLFEDYLCGKLSFIKLLPDPLDVESMQVDDEHEKSDVTVQRVFFYNKDSNSIWHGTLLDMTNISVSRSELILYSKTQEKSKVFLRVLDIELKTKCNIKKVRYAKRNLSTKLIEFEAALRDECASYLKMYLSVDRKEIECAQMAVHLNTLKADILFKNLDSCVLKIY